MISEKYSAQTIMDMTNRHVMNTYARQPVVLDRGEGSYVWDLEGKKYLDFLTGISVLNLGHRPPAVLYAWQEQLNKILHCSNIYFTAPAAILAQMLTERTFADRVFFSNSGAEANEAAFKLARRYASLHRGEDAREIICMNQSFHGRTLATLSATGQEKIRKGFEPFLPGFSFVPFGDLEALQAAINKKTTAVLLEPIQGEGGVHVPPEGYLKNVRKLCDAEGILLILDEVQVGMGRTGKFCAHEWEGITPDIMTLSKALGGGLPLGACLATEKVAQAFQPGSHASTFGGNPLACAGGQAMVQMVSDSAILKNCLERGEQFKAGLTQIAQKFDFVLEVRGRGLILGLEVNFDAKDLPGACLNQGLLVNLAGPKVLRFLPPLNVKAKEVEEALAIVEGVLGLIP